MKSDIFYLRVRLCRPIRSMKNL